MRRWLARKLGGPLASDLRICDHARRIIDLMHQQVRFVDPETGRVLGILSGRPEAAAARALREIADQDPTELVLDPTWSQRIAAAALAAQDGER